MMKKWLSRCLAGAVLSAALALPVGAANTLTTGETVDPWAQALAEQAVAEKLMPQCLEGQDLRQNITRAQFAALAVKLYEAMSGDKVLAPAKNPFVDTEDAEVLKAYRLGIVSGMTEDTFCPDELVTREQAAVMLTGAFQASQEREKKAYLLWVISQGQDNSLNGDTDLTQQQSINLLAGIYHRLDGTLDTKGAQPFLDDGDISQWARESVYFMEKSGIIAGMGDGRFAPRDNAQCQAALCMAVKMLDKLG